MEILQTKDYELFDTITGNRVLNLPKIIRISTDVETGFNMLPYCPIIVHEKDKKFYIIDGQHRFEISKRTDNPVYYVICNELSLLQIAIMNSRAEKWKPTDFLHCYINLGLEDYSEILHFMNKHKTNIRLTTDLLMYGYIGSGKTTEAFQTGNFKCNFLKDSEAMIALTDDIFGQYTFSRDRYLISALQTIKKKGVVDWERLKLKINTKPMLMDKQGDHRSYVLNIERVYNDGAQKRVLLT